MRKKTITAIDGKKIELWEPETEKDRKELQRLIAEGKASSRSSFGDWKKKPKNENRS